MSELDCDAIPSPPCPVCGAPTKLKHRHKNSKSNEDTCVFKCTACGVEYPIHVPLPTPGGPRTRA
jgi:hypothetical protein